MIRRAAMLAWVGAFAAIALGSMLSSIPPATAADPAPTVAPSGTIGTPLVSFRPHHRKHHHKHRQIVIPAITQPPTDTEG